MGPVVVTCDLCGRRTRVSPTQAASVPRCPDCEELLRFDPEGDEPRPRSTAGTLAASLALAAVLASFAVGLGLLATRGSGSTRWSESIPQAEPSAHRGPALSGSGDKTIDRRAAAASAAVELSPPRATEDGATPPARRSSVAAPIPPAAGKALAGLPTRAGRSPAGGSSSPPPPPTPASASPPPPPRPAEPGTVQESQSGVPVPQGLRGTIPPRPKPAATPAPEEPPAAPGAESRRIRVRTESGKTTVARVFGQGSGRVSVLLPDGQLRFASSELSKADFEDASWLFGIHEGARIELEGTTVVHRADAAFDVRDAETTLAVKDSAIVSSPKVG